jgi:hypothetical protein
MMFELAEVLDAKKELCAIRDQMRANAAEKRRLVQKRKELKEKADALSVTANPARGMLPAHWEIKLENDRIFNEITGLSPFLINDIETFKSIIARESWRKILNGMCAWFVSVASTVSEHNRVHPPFSPLPDPCSAPGDDESQVKFPLKVFDVKSEDPTITFIFMGDGSGATGVISFKHRYNAAFNELMGEMRVRRIGMPVFTRTSGIWTVTDSAQTKDILSSRLGTIFRFVVDVRAGLIWYAAGATSKIDNLFF